MERYCNYDTLLLDRDGTINERRPNDYVKTWSEFQFRPEFLRWAPMLGHTFRHIFVVTNQRGIGKGVMTEQVLADIHRQMCQILASDYGLKVDDIFYALAIDNADPMRKPQTGMWQKLLEAYPYVQAERTVMIGDGDCDEAFARNCQIAFVRV
ncbi:MAG: HAD-IIIA family hydrolase [Bacteroidales bacterium]|nr:HAD-IIIA family hydrolase [Bacteroidales bacterium]